MAVDPLTTTDAVMAALLRPLTADEQTYVPTLISQASAKLRTRMRAVDTRIAAYNADPTDPSGLDPAAVEAMLAGVIKRYIVNPQGAQNLSDTILGMSRTYTFPSGGGAWQQLGELVITDADLASLEPASSFVMPGTIRTRPRYDDDDPCWLP